MKGDPLLYYYAESSPHQTHCYVRAVSVIKDQQFQEYFTFEYEVFVLLSGKFFDVVFNMLNRSMCILKLFNRRLVYTQNKLIE